MSAKSLQDLKVGGNTIHAWMEAYDHHAPEGQVLCEGRYQDVSAVFARVYNPKTKKIDSEWRYDKDGLTQKSYIKFNTLTPTHDHTFDPLVDEGKCYFVIKSKSIGFWGRSRHVYMELINSERQGISIGLCGPVQFPLQGTRGALVSPDPKEAVSGTERKTYIAIGQRSYNEIFRRIIRDKQEGREYFHILDYNCAHYTTVIAREHLGIDIDNHEFPTQAMARGVLDHFNIRMPKPILRIMSVVSSIFRFLLTPLYLLGWVLLAAPFKDRKGAIAYQKTFPNSGPGVLKRMKMIVTGEFLRISTGYKVSVWQDLIGTEFGTGRAITLDQARSLKLGSETVQAIGRAELVPVPPAENEAETA